MNTTAKWLDSETERPRDNSSIIIFDDCGNVHRALYVNEDKILIPTIVETPESYDGYLTECPWNEIKYWMYANIFEKVVAEADYKIEIV